MIKGILTVLIEICLYWLEIYLLQNTNTHFNIDNKSVWFGLFIIIVFLVSAILTVLPLAFSIWFVFDGYDKTVDWFSEKYSYIISRFKKWSRK